MWIVLFQLLDVHKPSSGNEEEGIHVTFWWKVCCHFNLIAYFLYPKEIKLGKFQEAVDDCDHVLSIEPKNVKGTTFSDSQ